MSIEGLKGEQDPKNNIGDDVGANVEALRMLNLVEDEELVRETIRADFAKLSRGGLVGEPYIQIPRRLATLPQMINALDNGRYSNGQRGMYPFDTDYPETALPEMIHPDINIPGAQQYKEEDIGNLIHGEEDDSWPAHARLAVHGTESSEEPLIHFLGMGFDSITWDVEGEETQRDAIARVKEQYEAEHKGFTMTPLNMHALVMLSLVRRIKGLPGPVAGGGSGMRDATMPTLPWPGDKPPDTDDPIRKSLYQPLYYVLGMDTDPRYEDGVSALRIGGDHGHAEPETGVGLSIGPRNLLLK